MHWVLLLCNNLFSFLHTLRIQYLNEKINIYCVAELSGELQGLMLDMIVQLIDFNMFSGW